MKHKHYDMIVAWAGGATIQFKHATVVAGKWHDCPGGKPEWNDHCEYRVKPQPKQLWVRPYNTPDGTGRAVATADNPAYISDKYNLLEWIGPAVLVWEEKI